MAQGGGFCERHGPFDPPHRVCPFCVLEDEQRRLYGPPPGATAQSPGRTHAAPPEAPAADDEIEAEGFARQEIEPDDLPGFTELAPPDAVESEAAEGDARPLGWLVVKHPAEQRGTILPIASNQSIGREGDIRWDDPGLSRQHARLTLEPPEGAPDAMPVFHLWPFAPTNPVYINGREIRGATPLQENDEIRLGNTLFVFKTLTD